jgi:predicted Rossmann fold flavoprotein
MHMTTYDVIVIGGGPAGLMAAGQAASCGASTLLLEKMSEPGRKLRITGKGRCNLTNMAPLEDFIEHFQPNGRFLRHAFSVFFSDDLTTFFHELGIQTVVERGGRVFPVRNDAQEIVDALTHWVDLQGVHTNPNTKVEGIRVEGSDIAGVRVAPSPAKHSTSPTRYQAKSVILATGGASYPGTGSTGDGYVLAKNLGHTIMPIRPALVPLVTSGDIARRLQGLSLRNVKASVIIDEKKFDDTFGEMLFTHFGLSGPIILSLSRSVVDALEAKKKVEISIDLKPALDEKKLDARLLRDLDAHGKQQYKTLLSGLLPRLLIPVCVEQTNIPAEKPAHQISSEDRLRLRKWLKDFRFKVTRHRSFNQAIITAGGVSTREIDPRTMASRKISGLYFAGEVLDVDADTGGYNLQAAFSTGWLAGRSAAGPFSGQ